MKIFLFYLTFTFSTTFLWSQTVYKTPSGNKFHTSTCRFLKNVSHKLTLEQALSKGLSPCSICKPNFNSVNRMSTVGLGIKSNEVKRSTSAVQCKGKTKTGKRCSRKTRNTNGYCFQHEK